MKMIEKCTQNYHVNDPYTETLGAHDTNILSWFDVCEETQLQNARIWDISLFDDSCLKCERRSKGEED